MNETTLVNLHTLIFVPLIVAFLLALPRVTRKGLLFGVYVGEAAGEGEPARHLVRAWRVWLLPLAPVALLLGLGLGLSGHARAGNYSALGLVALWGIVLYLSLHFAARRLAPATPPGAVTTAAAHLVAEPPLEMRVPLGAFAASVILGLATVGYAALAFDDLPLQLPRHFDTSGQPDAWSARSWGRVLSMPLLTLGSAVFFGLAGVLMAGAKRSLRSGTGGHSVEAQRAFRRQIVWRSSGIAFLGTVTLAWISVQVIRLWLGQTRSIGSGYLWVFGLLLVFAFGSLAYVILEHGQGGALREEGSPEAPLTNGLADDRHWIWGCFYVNREDPSLLVEARFGIGYTANLGNWRAVAIVTLMTTALVVPLVVMFTSLSG